MDAVPTRAGLAAVLAVSAAGMAHVAAGGAVALGGAAWALAALAGPAWWLARRERGWVVLAGTQLAGQQLAHLLLGVGIDSTGTHTAGVLPADLMLHAHLAAAALCGLWLRVGERRAVAAIRDAVRVCVLLVLPGPPPVAAPAPRRAASTVRPHIGCLRHCLARRGPPVPAAPTFT